MLLTVFLVFIIAAESFKLFPIPKGYYQQWYGGTNHQISNYTDFSTLPGSISSNLICPPIAGVHGTLLCSNDATNNPVYGPIPKKLIEYTVKCPYLSPPSIFEKEGGRTLCLNYLYVQGGNTNDICTTETGIPFCLYVGLEDSSKEYFPGYVGYYLNPQGSTNATLNIIPAEPAPQKYCDEYTHWSLSSGPSHSFTLTKALCVNPHKERVVEGTYLGEMISYYKPPPGLGSYYVDGTAGMYYVSAGNKPSDACDGYGSEYELRCYYLVPRDKMVKLMLYDYA